MEWINHTPSAQDYKIMTRPSEVFARQVYATYEDDRIGVKLIPDLGIDNVMWASDYPHPDSTFPHSIQAIEEQFAAMDPAVKRKVTSETAARSTASTVRSRDVSRHSRSRLQLTLTRLEAQIAGP